MRPDRAAPSRVLLGLALMLVAFNLRPALSTVGPLLATIRDSTARATTLSSTIISRMRRFFTGGAGWRSRELASARSTVNTFRLRRRAEA